VFLCKTSLDIFQQYGVGQARQQGLGLVTAMVADEEARVIHTVQADLVMYSGVWVGLRVSLCLETQAQTNKRLTSLSLSLSLSLSVSLSLSLSR